MWRDRGILEKIFWSLTLIKDSCNPHKNMNHTIRKKTGVLKDTGRKLILETRQVEKLEKATEYIKYSEWVVWKQLDRRNERKIGIKTTKLRNY